MRLPILISYNTRFYGSPDSIEIRSGLKFGDIKIGFGNIKIFDKKNSKTILNIDGRIIFEGKAFITHGAKILVGPNGTMTIGDGFSISSNSQIVCENCISFGKDVLISWDCLFMDTDYHTVLRENVKSKVTESIKIGNHVWFGCRSTILKGVEVSDNTVVAANSLLVKKYSSPNILVGGVPAKIISYNIDWIR